MESQRDLFGWADDHQRDLEAKHLARSTDPETSKSIAADIARDGTVARLKQIVLKTLLHHPNSTASECSMYSRVENLHKRFKELEREGLVRVTGTRACRVTGKTVQTYCVRMD